MHGALRERAASDMMGLGLCYQSRGDYTTVVLYLYFFRPILSSLSSFHSCMQETMVLRKMVKHVQPRSQKSFVAEELLFKNTNYECRRKVRHTYHSSLEIPITRAQVSIAFSKFEGAEHRAMRT